MKEEVKSLIIGIGIFGVSFITLYFKSILPTFLLGLIGVLVGVSFIYSLIVIIGMLILLRR